MTPKRIVFVLIFLIYVIGRVTLNLPALAKPRELADTVSYLRISKEPISDVRFWGDARPFVFPLLLKISGQNDTIASILQLAFSILAWGALALTISCSLSFTYLQLFSFCMILVLSLVRHLASWDYVMMTESLSVSWFVLFLALAVWLARGWRTYKVVLLIIAAIFLAFTRDTNAYLLLILAGLLALAALFRWTKPYTWMIAASFAFIFLINNFTSEIGDRWVFPLNNIVGRRILVNGSAMDYFKSCGMPFTPQLLALANTFANGQDRAFYEDPALKDYRAWLAGNGKSCYMKWLVFNPVQSVGSALKEFESLVRFDTLDSFFSRKYHPLIPYYIEPFIYPVIFIPALWILLTLAALFGIWKRRWDSNPLWGVYILLCLSIFPHLFISWHGDAMAPERHALSAGLQLALCLWLVVFLLLDEMMKRGKMDGKPNAFHRLIHRVVMIRPVTAFFARKIHRIDGRMLKLTKGRYTFSEIAGWPIIQLITTGAKTGRLHNSPLIGLFDGEKIALIASSFGRQHNPSWYYNLKATPQCEVQFKGRSGKYVARETLGEEREKYWQLALSYYEGYDMYKARAAHRQIPVLILEPVK
jgi:deazaflavin-dependent oxidoreductase (nitroreductase family)